MQILPAFVKQFQRRRDRLGKGHGRKPVKGWQTGIEDSRYHCGLNAARWNAPAGSKMLQGCQPGCGALTSDDRDIASLPIGKENRHLATEAERLGMRNTHGKDCGNTHITGITAALEDLDTRLYGGKTASGNGSNST
jgi:hypothetical protein